MNVTRDYCIQFARRGVFDACAVLEATSQARVIDGWKGGPDQLAENLSIFFDNCAPGIVVVKFYESDTTGGRKKDHEAPRFMRVKIAGEDLPVGSPIGHSPELLELHLKVQRMELEKEFEARLERVEQTPDMILSILQQLAGAAMSPNKNAPIAGAENVSGLDPDLVQAIVRLKKEQPEKFAMYSQALKSGQV